jgi:hypothetical protein
MTEPGPWRPARRSRTTGRAVVAGGVAGVVVAVLLLGLLLELARSPDVKNTLGDAVFVAPRAVELAPVIAHGGSFGRAGPLLFQDLLGNSRDIYLQHLGTDALVGWVAFEAHPVDEPRRCVVQWQPDTSTFRDPCSARTFPADGRGLVRFPTRVNAAHRVEVDLRHPIAGSGALG